MGFTSGPLEIGPGLHPEEHHEAIKPVRNFFLGAIGVGTAILLGPEIIEAARSGFDVVGAFITELAGRQE